MGIVSIVTMLLPLLMQLLSNSNVVSPNLSNLVVQLGGAIGPLIASLLSGKGPTNDVLAILTAIKTEVSALKTGTALLSSNDWNEITAVDAALSDAINAYQAALVTTDPSNLTPLPEAL